MNRKKLFLSLCLSAAGLLAAYAGPSTRTENTVRVMSYNVRNAVGLDHVTDYRRIADVIADLSPDVVALQELDSVTNRSNRADVLARLADLTKMYAVYGASIPYDGGKYGIGILSKTPPQAWKRIPLPGREEARSLLLVEFEEYVFCCTHFSLNEEDRQASVQVIDEAVKTYDKPVFLAGDINAVPDSPVLEAFRKNWKILSDTRQFTFPADKPDRTIDYLMGYLAGGAVYSVWQTGVFPEPEASDHRPLFADVRLKTPKDRIFRTQPYLQSPAPDGMTVTWMTHVPCHSWVEAGTDTTNLQPVSDCVEGEKKAYNTLNRIRLKGLQPGVRYYYRICSREVTLYQPYRKEFGETAVSPVASFTTPDNRQTDFTAVIFNDLHDHYALFDRLMAQVKDIPYDVVFFNGDCIADVQTEAAAVRSIAHYNAGFGSDRTPAVYIRGNHETRGAYSIFLWDLLEKPGGDHSYGAFQLGDTRFVLLDCGEDKPDDHPVYFGLNDFTQYRKDQAAFLRQELSSKAFRSASRRVLIHHIPVYGGETYNPCRDYWGDLLSRARFDICLNAHMHTFRYLPGGEAGNPFPVVIGGGNSEQSATVMILRKRGKELKLQVLNAQGDTLLNLEL
ncbi:MAG: endonuclease/exonuclease/phosphatase family protein [Tannerella sp.]|jgi:endonuclease/exonuclease/phosphatase family metal-dependent hydrolase|nr:endonuclease/exonuclease/phosphatase family protein [Tannerella sp.]